MKKLLIAFGAGLIAASVYASCVGPYCYDERGAQISTGVGIGQHAAADFPTLNPSYAGQMVMCNNCTDGGVGAATGYNLCVASGTGQGAWVQVSSVTLSCK